MLHDVQEDSFLEIRFSQSSKVFTATPPRTELRKCSEEENEKASSRAETNLSLETVGIRKLSKSEEEE